LQLQSWAKKPELLKSFLSPFVGSNLLNRPGEVICARHLCLGDG